MATTHKLFVVQTKNGVVRVQKLRVEDDLDSIRASVEELDSSDLIQDRVGAVVLHVVGDDRGKRVPLQRENSPLQRDLVRIEQKRAGIGYLGSGFSVMITALSAIDEETAHRNLPMVPRGVFKNPVTDLGLDLGDGIPQLFHHCLSL